MEDQAEVAGFPPGMRYFPRDAEHVALFEKDFIDSWARERAFLRTQGQDGPLPPAAYLAISGGGDNGAFGAGLLNGWTKAGTRPNFKLVTGVSTRGAHRALRVSRPGARRDAQGAVHERVAQGHRRDARSPVRILRRRHGRHRAAGRAPEEVRHPGTARRDRGRDAKGRILLVGTANLDARRPVIWNITKIAASRRPGALELVRKILLASAAIPGTFPPVVIDAHVGSLEYQEMHVDGGTATQVFVYPAAVDLEKLSTDNDSQWQRTLYIIRNSRLDPEWAQVDRRTLSIALRAISCLIQYQGMGDLYRIYTIAHRDKVGYNLAYIPATFSTPHTSDFDTAYMRSLFDVAFKMAQEGAEWATHPPILLSGEGSDSAAVRR